MNRTQIIQANRDLRACDESHLAPIRGRFNATDRAIKRISRQFGAYIDEWSPEEYLATVNAEVSKIVNSHWL